MKKAETTILRETMLDAVANQTGRNVRSLKRDLLVFAFLVDDVNHTNEALDDLKPRHAAENVALACGCSLDQARRSLTRLRVCLLESVIRTKSTSFNTDSIRWRALGTK